MKVSFIIPAYNEGNYLGKCLESILLEIFNSPYHVEIIVVNNASTDNTKEVALSFPGVKIIDELQKGLVHARQAGFLASTGDFIVQLDADTILSEGWMGIAMKELSKNPKLVAVSGPVTYYDVSPAINRIGRLYSRVGFISYLINRFVLRVGSMLQGGLCIIKRSALEQIEGYNSKISFYGEDTDLARRLHAIGGVKFTFKLTTHSSGRRVIAEGLVRTGVRYYINYMWATFIKRPYDNSYIDIRDTVDPLNNIGFKSRLRFNTHILVGIIWAIAFLGIVAGVQASRGSIASALIVGKVKIISEKAIGIYNSLDVDGITKK